MEFFHKNEYVRSYSIYKHDTTLKMAFAENFILANFKTGPPNGGGSFRSEEVDNIDIPSSRISVLGIYGGE